MDRIALLLLLCCAAIGQSIPPASRPILKEEKIQEWTFDQGIEGWTAGNNCVLSHGEGTLVIESQGEDPYLYGPPLEVQGPLSVEMSIRCEMGGGGAIYWITREDPQWSEQQCVRFPLSKEPSWQKASAILETDGLVTGIRLDPGNEAGKAAVDLLKVLRIHRHPLQIVEIEARDEKVICRVQNLGENDLSVQCGGQDRTVAAGETEAFETKTLKESPFEEVIVEVTSEGLPPLVRSISVFHPGVETEWRVLQGKEIALKVSSDGKGARIERKGQLVAVLCPLLQLQGRVPEGLRVQGEVDEIALRAQGIQSKLSLEGDSIRVKIECDQECEGPVVRVLGTLQGGLFSGLEYLGLMEASSSTLDIETEEHVRYAPDRHKVTQPLMALHTDEASAAMTWRDMSLQPIYASPNFLQGTKDHRMSLKGSKIDCTLRVVDPTPVEESISWFLGYQDLPSVPFPPRTKEAQWELCLDALEGPIRGEGGWGHCAEKRWARQPFADVASTIWRLTGEAPELDTLVPGGAHIRNDAIYFVTGRAEEWLKMRRDSVRGLLAQQKEDGSFRYQGEFLKGHFEDTASGYCAQRASSLLEFARYTGDKKALDGAVKALEYMKRFQVPRGAQTWELSLHTPDILASAYLVWAYTRGYELTGEEEYLNEARRWGLSGVPFVYLWEDQPIMLYSTIAVFGATHWRAPNWMGLPVQWCGGVYAYALGLLAPHDRTVDWGRLARGILISAEQQQYPDGELVGTLPDSFDIKTQQRRGPNINPCALASLRMLLDGELHSLAVAEKGLHRVVAPFPVRIEGEVAVIQGEEGCAYQVVVDGVKAVDVKSQGIDRLALW